ncbi:type III R-M system methyltransferase [Helicobacter pylori]|uniref:site-specific DNA-methyltransferase (adenine-specific) n=1 Tax=Helicobacter pylori TaxID=210 RepID=A0A377RP46_HELPX|nr:site-specific DNA-methyltransferase [Helicobacter pylori]STR19660.1 type III R-M system methyltransferase [Helicobacter pylori]
MQNKEIGGEKSVNEKNVEVFNRYFPGCLSIENDNKLTLDTKKLKALLGDFSEIKEEGYGLDFVGKKIALNQAFKKNNKILKPLNESNSKHILIKGDNLDALKILKQSYSEKIKMIYIDPPYNTKNENFIYGDDFSQSNEEILKTLDYSKEKLDYIKNLFGSKSHSGWLSFMYPRLLLAKDLLKQDGVIFISIDDNECAQLKLLCDEIFGERNFLSSLTWLKGNAQNDAQYFQNNYENILVYAKHVEALSLNRMTSKKEVKVFCENDKYYYEGAGLTTGGAGGTLNARSNLGYSIYYNPKTLDFQGIDDYDKELAKSSNNENLVYSDRQDLLKQGYKIIRPPKKGVGLGRWTWALDTFNSNKNIISIKKNSRNEYVICKKEFLDKNQVKQNENGEFYAILDKSSPARNVIENIGGGNGTKEVNDLFNQKIFNNPKPLKLISRLIELSTNEGDLILDFFAGSGTTAHAVLESNKSDYQKLSEGGGLFNGLNAAFKERRFILVQLDEKIDPKNKNNKSAYDFCLNTLKSTSPSIFDITEERIKRAGAKIKEACPHLDVGFRAFEIIDDETHVNDKNLSQAHQKDLFAYSNPKKWETQTILIKLLGCEGLELTTPITCLIENALYLAENTAFIVGDIEMSEVLENLKDKGVEKISMYMPAISNDRLCLELGSNLFDLKLESGDLKIRG